MRLYQFVFVAFLATAIAAEKEKEKRRAQSSTEKSSFVTTTSAPSYATASEENYVTASTSAPAYATKLSSNPKIRYVTQLDQPESSYQQHITIQPKLKLSYGTQPIRQPAQQVYIAQPQYPQQQFAYSFEAAQQPEQVKYASVAAQPQIKYISLPQAQYLTAAPQQFENIKHVAQKEETQQPQIHYQYQPQPQLQPQIQYDQVKYVAQIQSQPQQYEQVKYVNLPQSQPAPQTVKYVYAPQPQQEVKYTYSPQPQQEVKYAYSQPAPVTKTISAAPAKVAYQAPARPHYSPADTVSHFRFSSPHVTYSNLGVLSQIIGKGYNPPQPVAAAQTHQPQYQQQYSAPPQYITAATAQRPQQVAYGPAGHFQIPQVQYVQSGPQHAQSGKQYVYALPQNLAHKKNYFSAGVTYA